MRVSMQHALWLAILLAGIGRAQSRTERDILAAHNAVRAHLGIAPLKWSDHLADCAENWASTLLARGQFAHRPNSNYGENLFEIQGATASPAQVVEACASE